MHIYVSKTNNDRRDVNKNVYSETLFENVILKEETSIIDPVLILTGRTLKQCVGLNYVYVPIFGRYYFINDIVATTGNRIELHCHVDVLNTFKKDIYQMNATIVRNEKNRDSAIVDDQYVTYCKQVLKGHKLEGGLVSGLKYEDSESKDNKHTNVLITSGMGAENNGN